MWHNYGPFLYAYTVSECGKSNLSLFTETPCYTLYTNPCFFYSFSWFCWILVPVGVFLPSLLMTIFASSSPLLKGTERESNTGLLKVASLLDMKQRYILHPKCSSGEIYISWILTWKKNQELYKMYNKKIFKKKAR